MNKKEQGLFDKFKKVEVELLQVLSESGAEKIDFEQSKTVVKSQLKAYVKKVEKAGKLFEEYEKLADEIEKLTQNETKEADGELGEVAEAVVALRESNIDESEYVDAIDATTDVVKVVKKKKNKSSVKEF